jgi:hypothetical protein
VDHAAETPSRNPVAELRRGTPSWNPVLELCLTKYNDFVRLVFFVSVVVAAVLTVASPVRAQT